MWSEAIVTSILAIPFNEQINEVPRMLTPLVTVYHGHSPVRTISEAPWESSRGRVGRGRGEGGRWKGRGDEELKK